jgi:cardiolipin synthase
MERNFFRLYWQRKKYVSAPTHLDVLWPDPIYRELIQEINGAKKTVYLATPYFLPPYRLRQALRWAIRRGADVRVLMSARTDVPLADHVSHSYFPKLLRNGIRIFLFQNTVMHAKYTIIDGRWATIGSTNLDYLSLLRNREANVVTTHEETVAEISRQYEKDLENCIEVDMQYYRNILPHYKIIGRLGRLIKHWM